MRRDVFQAIADPTRRAIIGRIAGKSVSVNEVATGFREVSRQAISKHLKILTECGLVHISTQGRERYCSGRLEPLHEIDDWLNSYRRFYEASLDSLEQYLDQLQSKNKRNVKRNVAKNRKRRS